jgi:hypothetical protein
MNTIFISAFQGVEIKNILRTPILTTILSSSNVRLVIFTKNHDRVRYLEEQFKDERIEYIAVKIPEPKGIDAFFARLKFTLLRTPSTDLKRRLVYEAHVVGQVSYMTGRFINLVLANRAVRSVFRFLDKLVIGNRYYSRYFAYYRPSLVFLAHIFDESEIDLLREARRRRITTVGFINSWDKLSIRGALRLLTDYFVVFNHIVKKELVDLGYAPEKRIFVGGIPQYDHYALPATVSRSAFMQRLGFSETSRLLVYASMGRTFSDSDWLIIDKLHELNKAQIFGPCVEILVRFQPNDFIDERELKARPELVYDYPGTRFTAKRGIDWDMNKSDLEHLRNTLTHMDVLLSYASSIVVDAAFYDKPIINIDFELIKFVDPRKSPTRYYAMDHYSKALATGAIKMAGSESALIEAVKGYLNEPSLDRDARARLVREQCVYTDGRCGKRIGDFLLAKVHGKVSSKNQN